MCQNTCRISNTETKNTIRNEINIKGVQKYYVISFCISVSMHGLEPNKNNKETNERKG